ncbi:MAG TPA: hypothetical protein VIS77_15645 [Burkholderiales bacterium]
MNFFIWMLAGAAVGWLAVSFMGFNEQRGTIVATIIGAVGGIAGGKLVAPLFAAASVTAAAPSDINTMAVVSAVGTAAVFVAAGHFLEEKFGF